MPNLDDGLIAYFPLAEPLANGPIDRSPANLAVTVSGLPVLIADPQLGAAFQFAKGDGLGFALTGADFAFTFQLWVRRNDSSGDAAIVTFGSGVIANPAGLYSSQDGGCELRFTVGGPNLVSPYPGLLPAGQWTHLAIVGDGARIDVRKNGVLVSGGIAATKASLGKFQLCRLPDVAGATALFALAQVRLHNRALTGDEINQQFIADKTLRSAYAESHPIAFSLLDANESPTLYITDHPAGEPLDLELFNGAQRPVYLDTIAGTAGAGFCHFELRFRPGTLHKVCGTPGPGQARLLDAADWTMSDPVTQPDGTVSFYLLHNTAYNAPFEIPSERTIRLSLTNMRAGPGTGPRVSRMEVRYTHLRVGAATNALLTGSRITPFNIVSDAGRRTLPLHVGFVGGNTVLPNNTAGSSLRFSLGNASLHKPIPWQAGDPALTDASFFRISFDFEGDYEQKAWALARLNESKNLTVTSPLLDREVGRWIGTHTGAVRDITAFGRTLYVFTLEQTPAATPVQNGGIIYIQPPQGSKLGEIFAANFVDVPGLAANEIAATYSFPPVQGSEFYFWPQEWNVTPAAQGETPSWTVWSAAATDLAPDEQINLLIGGIVTSLPPGHTNLYVDYGNIPGYQPGRFVAVIDKNPISMGQETNGTASVQVHAAIDAATSEVYFTDTEHNHSGLGNVPGHAAIENAKDYDALMVLGRLDAAKGRRQLKLYDDVEIAGNLLAKGTLRSNLALEASTSEIYFTDTEHNHTGNGNVPGHAAIENAKDYDALMVLGRLDAAKGNRQLKLYDDVEISGGLTAKGAVEIDGALSLAQGLLSKGVVRVEDDKWIQTGAWKIGVSTQGSDLEFTHQTSGNKFVFGEDGHLRINGKIIA